jgi:P27 family predicted phage terminase small subunit
MPLLLQIKMMTEIDRALLTSYCRAWGRFMEAEAEMTAEAARRGEAHCLLVENKTGEMVVNPLVAVSFKAMEAIHKYAKEFGMTPSARMSVRPSEAASDGNPFDAFRKIGT